MYAKTTKKRGIADVDGLDDKFWKFVTKIEIFLKKLESTFLTLLQT